MFFLIYPFPSSKLFCDQTISQTIMICQYRTNLLYESSQTVAFFCILYLLYHTNKKTPKICVLEIYFLQGIAIKKNPFYSIMNYASILFIPSVNVFSSYVYQPSYSKIFNRKRAHYIPVDYCLFHCADTYIIFL